MMNKKYKREYKKSQPVLAICYDFDRTLSPDDMQAQGYIQSVGYDVGSFWKESNGLAEANDMDQNLAYMYLMKETAAGKVLFTKEKLEDYGSKVDLFPGVEDWFERIRNYGTQQGVIVEHYIISSGLKEMIEGTSVAKKGAFKKIYASSFYYNADGVAVWPAQVVNYTNKTQFLFRIEKGVLDINDDGVNDSFPPDELRIPFRNMIYIGDSDTYTCSKLEEHLNEPNHNDMFIGSAGGFGTDRLHAGGQQSRRRAKYGAECCEQCGTKCTAGKHGTARAGND